MSLALVPAAAPPRRRAGDDGLFDVVLADPPWSYERDNPDRPSPGDHYPTMSLLEIECLAPPAARDCVLYLWATAPLLEEGLRVVRAWGFRYRTCAVWDKLKIGMGYWLRVQHELLLVGVRGKPSVPPPPLRFRSVFRAPRGRHSAKPPAVHAALERAFPEARRLEMFARVRRPGWSAWGNEVDSDAAVGSRLVRLRGGRP